MATAATAGFEKLCVEAASVDTKKRIYFIGPYGRRVSFASQQKRALNTVWALERAGSIVEGNRVAVIGGGLAGITVATALLARKCLVWLYEARPRVLDLQWTTMHRFIHPSINFWPESEIEPTTLFPFYDWHADTCALVIRHVEDEWKKHFEKRLTRIFTDTTVTEVESRTKDVLIRSQGLVDEAEYDLAIIATGFGQEKTVVGAENIPYWDKDYLPEKGKANARIIVSGTGDGGLVDALRAVHEDFRAGKLCVEVASLLNATGIKKRLADVERSVTLEAGGDLNKASIRYNEEYRKLVQDTPQHCLSAPNRSLTRKDPVKLIGPTPFPFSLIAAPINKYLIAHAMLQGAVEYEQGRLFDGPHIEPLGKAKQLVEDVMCVARHGATPPLAGILSDSEIAVLKQKQLKIADLPIETLYQGKDWAGFDDYPAQEFDSLDFVENRLPLAEHYVWEEHKLHLRLGLIGAAPMYLIEKDASQQMAVPSTLFGVPTKVTPKWIANG